MLTHADLPTLRPSPRAVAYTVEIRRALTATGRVQSHTDAEIEDCGSWCATWDSLNTAFRALHSYDRVPNAIVSVVMGYRMALADLAAAAFDAQMKAAA